MSTLDGLYIDAVVIKGSGKTFSVSIQQKNEENTGFEPFDLSNYAIKFSVLGAPTADSTVLLEHIITTNTDVNTEGIINNPTNGEFYFTVSKEDTDKLGLGKFPIKLELLDGESLEVSDIITEGNLEGEFNAIQILQV
jgi:hypothetical protein